MATPLPPSEDDLTTCSVCFEVYNVKKNCPKFLSCHHTFCLVCIGNIVTQGTMIRCPTCRVVTALPSGNTVSQLRTNGHALKLVELAVRAAKNRTERVAQLHPEWEQEIAKREKADKHLKVVVESLEVLQSHVKNTLSENAARLAQLKEKLGSVSSARFRSSLADNCKEPSDKDFSVTLEKAEAFQLALNLESVSGQVNHVSKKIKFDVLVPISENGVTAANLNVMGFSLLQFLKEELLQPPSSQLLPSPAAKGSSNPVPSNQIKTPPILPSAPAPAVTIPVGRTPQQAPAARPPPQVPAPLQASAANPSQVPVSRSGNTAVTSVPRPVVIPKICYMRLNLNGVLDLDPREGECDLVFETTPQSCAALCRIFERGCRHTSDMNYRDCFFLRACPGQFVLFGFDSGNVQYLVDQSLINKPLIRQRGDVGLYCESAVDDPFDCSVWDFVILLSDYMPHNLRPAPIVATLVRGFELCEGLSRLRADERGDVLISYIKVH